MIDEYKVYLAGPVQSREDNGQSWREETKDDSYPFEYLDPLNKYSPESLEQWTPEEIVTNDLQMIREADAVLVRYEGEPTWGTPMEVFFAAKYMDIPVSLAWCHDETVSPWAQHHADYISGDVRKAKAALRGLRGQFDVDLEPEFSIGVDLYADASEDIDADEDDGDLAGKAPEDVTERNTDVKDVFLVEESETAGEIIEELELDEEHQRLYDEHWGEHLGVTPSTDQPAPQDISNETSDVSDETSVRSDVRSANDAQSDAIGTQRMSDGGGCECDTSYYGGDAEDRSGDQLAATVAEDLSVLLGDTRGTHGDAVENQSHIAQFWTVYLQGAGLLAEDESLTARDAGRMEALIKVSRAVTGEEIADHDEDAAGYFSISAAAQVADAACDATIEDITQHVGEN